MINPKRQACKNVTVVTLIGSFHGLRFVNAVTRGYKAHHVVVTLLTFFLPPPRPVRFTNHVHLCQRCRAGPDPLPAQCASSLATNIASKGNAAVFSRCPMSSQSVEVRRVDHTGITTALPVSRKWNSYPGTQRRRKHRVSLITIGVLVESSFRVGNPTQQRTTGPSIDRQGAREGPVSWSSHPSE